MPKLSEARKAAIFVGVGAALILLALGHTIDFFLMGRAAWAVIIPIVQLFAGAICILAGLHRSMPDLPPEDFH